MGKKWDSPIQAKAEGSLCNIQIAFSFKLKLPSLPALPIPKLPKIPMPNLFCPLD
jgi:hypothetical protein